MKRFFIHYLWLKLLVLFTLLGCGELAVFIPGRATFDIQSEANLVEPDSYTLSWEPVKGARSYAVVVTNTETCDLTGMLKIDRVEDTTVVLDFLAEGVYSLCVYARISGKLIPANNNGIKLTIDRKDPVVTLPRQIPIVSAAFNPDIKIDDVSEVSYSWTQLDGEGKVSYLDNHSSRPGISADQTGLYTLSLKVKDQAGHEKEYAYQFYWRQPEVDPYAATLKRSGVAADTFVNSSEDLDTEPLWILHNDHSLTARYTLPIADPSLNLSCGENQTYDQSKIPSATDLPGADGTYVICAKLSIVGSDASYLKGESIIKDTVAPAVTSFVRSHAASDGLINDSEKNSNLALYTLVTAGGSAVGFSLPISDAGSSLVCDETISYGLSTMPSASQMTGDGKFAVCAKIIDVAGNILYSKSPSIDRDTTPATITVTSLTTTDITPALAGTVSDAAATVRVTVNGTTYNAVNDGAGNWTLANNAVEALPNGTHDIVAEATDASGNVSVDSTTNELVVNGKIFLSSWKTDNAGTSNAQSITLPLNVLGSYDFEADWGDGTVSYINSGSSTDKTHSYASPGTYTVSLRGSIEGFHFNLAGDKAKLLNISQWGGFRITSYPGVFWGAVNLTITATDALDLSGATSLEDMFADCSAITTIPNIETWNVSGVTNFNGVFAHVQNFNQNIGSWNVGSGVDFSFMFAWAAAFNQNIGGWNVSSATTIEAMFEGATAFNQNLNSWNVSHVTNMMHTFRLASAFNGNITSWNTGAVTDMNRMFADALVFNQNLNGWNVSNVTGMEAMFAGANAFNQSLNSWDVSKVKWMSWMFYSCDVFNGNISSWNTGSALNMRETFAYAPLFNQNIGAWNTSNVTTMRGMFQQARAFNQNISGWNTAAVSDFAWMFSGAIVFNQPIGSWATGSALVMDRMFYGATAFNQPIGSWDVADVWEFSSMFEEATNFNQPLNSWNVGSASLMSWMFKKSAFNQPLNSWNVMWVQSFQSMFERTPFNQDISSWNTSSGKNMSYMFYANNVFNQPIGSWNTANVTNFEHMFHEDYAFNQPIGTWNTANAVDMTGMFEQAHAFNQPLNSWNVAKVTATPAMFKHAWAFDQPLNSWQVGAVTNMLAMFESSPFNRDISMWNMSNVTNTSWMFKNAWNFNQPLNSWNVGNVTAMVAMFEGTPFNQSLASWNTSKVTDMSYMFKNASSFNQNISGWNTGAVTTMGAIFSFASAFNQNLGSWNVTNVTQMSWMFEGTSLSQANFDGILTGWAAQPVQSNVTLDASPAHYSAGAPATAKAFLTGTKGWTIYDAGVGP